MEAFLVSTCAVALAEIGDRTQLLVLLLAARFHKPFHIILGILAATLLNHGTVGYLSISLRALFDGELLRWLMSLSFIGMGVWMLGVDPQTEKPQFSEKYGAFLTTLVAFS
ncbi:MAG: TMEM165/GDT1 family protein [Cyanobacteria bacterium]|nr:TMEM165/GDT1 family protein [Cyanobacteriota bacterium]